MNFHKRGQQMRWILGLALTTAVGGLATTEDKPADAAIDTAKTDVSATGTTVSEEKPAEKKVEAKADDIKIDSPKPDAPKSSEKPADKPDDGAKLALVRNFEFKVPLAWLLATPVAPVESTSSQKPGQKPDQKTERKPSASVATTSKLRLRFSLWQSGLPVDSLPLEGWIELQVVSEGELLFGA